MTSRSIRIPGFRLDRAGKIVRDQRRLDVAARARQRGSKKVKVVRGVRT